MKLCSRKASHSMIIKKKKCLHSNLSFNYNNENTPLKHSVRVLRTADGETSSSARGRRTDGPDKLVCVKCEWTAGDVRVCTRLRRV